MTRGRGDASRSAATAVLLGAVAALASGCARKAPPPLGLEVEPEVPEHRVAAGETLFSIAERYGTTVETLVALNQLPNPNRLRVGQSLRLPAGTVPAEPRAVTPPRLDGGRAELVLDCAAHRDAPEGWPVSREGLSWPTDGVVLTRFGNLEGRRHEGLAIGAPLGTPVWSSLPGQVLLSGEEPGYGRLVVVDHGGGLLTLYGSLERACVAQGEQVGRGTLLGLVGVSSGVASPRLYFELRRGAQPVDPRRSLPRAAAR